MPGRGDGRLPDQARQDCRADRNDPADTATECDTGEPWRPFEGRPGGDRPASGIHGRARLRGELLGTFLEVAGPMLDDLDRAIAGKDVETLRRTAHTLKSNAATFGALPLSETCRELGAIARPGILTDAPELASRRDHVMRRQPSNSSLPGLICWSRRLTEPPICPDNALSSKLGVPRLFKTEHAHRLVVRFRKSTPPGVSHGRERRWPPSRGRRRRMPSEPRLQRRLGRASRDRVSGRSWLVSTRRRVISTGFGRESRG
jgi:HPt (histidine-containing phosphotransfer) domain-containing protein